MLIIYLYYFKHQKSLRFLQLCYYLSVKVNRSNYIILYLIKYKFRFKAIKDLIWDTAFYNFKIPKRFYNTKMYIGNNIIEEDLLQF